MPPRPRTTWAYDYLPKLDKSYDMLQVFELMNQGKMTGYICQGFNPLAAAPNKDKLTRGLSKLKFLVIMDPLATETSEFWRNFGEHNDVDSAKIQTEVFRLPTTCFAEEEGSLTNSARWLQWHWKGAEPPGEAKSDLEIMALIFTRMRGLYKTDGGKFPDPILNLTWPYADAQQPERSRSWPRSIRQGAEGSGRPEGSDQGHAQGGRAVGGFRGVAQRRHPPPAAAGSSAAPGRRPATTWRAATTRDPTGIGQTLNWACAWPANRRVLYNRASCDRRTASRSTRSAALIPWNGKSLGRRGRTRLQGRRGSHAAAWVRSS